MQQFSKRKTKSVAVGEIKIGSAHPIRVQSMTNTHTTDIEESVAQAIKMIDNGCELIRFAAQGKREIECLKEIKKTLNNNNYNVPLIADVHFNANIANLAAGVVDKVRVNPGNYAKKEFIKEKFSHLIDICKKHNTAIRVGVNHGSLSERMLLKFGNTPKGMVESCIEFLRISKQKDFDRVIVSLKASNVAMMIKSNRLLVKEMQKKQLAFPIHLGVTEAGGGNSGRVKSVIGIGTLLNEGIGDTIRVSLTESPVNEIIFAKKIIKFISKNPTNRYLKNGSLNLPFDNTLFYKRPIHNINSLENNKPIIIIRGNAVNSPKNKEEKKQSADFYLLENHKNAHSIPYERKFIVPLKFWQNAENIFPLLSAKEFLNNKNDSIAKSKIIFIESNVDDLCNDFFKKINLFKNAVLIAKTDAENSYAIFLQFFHYLYNHGCNAPVVLHGDFYSTTIEDLQLKASISMGGLFVDGLANGIFLESKSLLSTEEVIKASFEILQGAGVRKSKAEFVSCPGCGRTFFELEKVSQKVKNSFQHLKHLKIAVMGCIVNGIGEMGDADYGYVGSSIDKINLYKGKELVARNIPDNQAIEELKNIIIRNNDWKEK